MLVKLFNIQQKLKVPKTQRNEFGKYNYRNCEDILESIKPILAEEKCIIKLEDELCLIGERYYIKATAKIIDTETGKEECNTAYAREEESKKGMDGSQVTGASSSYARKYALNGLLAIDDTKDSDTTNVGNTTNKTENKRTSPKIDGSKIKALQVSIQNNNISKETVQQILSKFKYKNLEEIQIMDYAEIIIELKKSITNTKEVA